MRRLAAIIALAVLAVAAATIADYPGAVDINWQGWEIDTSVGVLVAALALLALVIWLLLLLIAAAIRLPRNFRRNRRARRGRLGEQALTRGMIAIAAGDGAVAKRQAERAEWLLGPTPLTLMLAAQAAQLGGDEAGARQRYTALLDRKEAALLGLKGLLGQALKTGDGDEALRLAERAHQLRPNAAWAFETLFALQTRAEKWEAARDTLAVAARRNLLPASRARHHRGALLYELSLVAEHEGDRRRALALAAGAQDLLPDIAAAAVRHARLLIAEDRHRAARRVVEQAWRTAPHPALAAVWGELGGAGPALELVAWVEKLAMHNPASPETAIARAEAALAAQLWGEARRHLGEAMAAAPGGPGRRLCLLMARLDDGEHPGDGRGREWLGRALAAPPDPAYLCARCGGTEADWRALCGHCRGFDTLSWQASGGQRPVPAAVLADLVAPAPLLPTPDGLASAGQSVR
jgi:HemY protein